MNTLEPDTVAASPAPAAAAARVLVLAPLGRDTSLACSFLGTRGVATQACADITSLCDGLNENSGAVLVTQEGLDRAALSRLAGVLGGIPGGAELAVLLLTLPPEPGRPDPYVLEILRTLAKVTLIPRPVHSATLLEVVRAALRERQRYQALRERAREYAVREQAASRSALQDSGLRQVLAAAPVAIFVIADGDVVLVNRAALALIGATEAGEVVGRQIYPWVHPDGVPELLESVERVMRGAQPGATMEQKWVRRDASTMDVEVMAAATSWDGKPAALLCARDVTDTLVARAALRRQLDDLARADERKNEFVAIVAHELRNPLAPIHNAVHVLKIQPDPPDPKHYRWATDVINRQVHHITRLVDDLLDISRVAYGRVKLQKEALELERLLAQAVETARPLMMARKQQLVYTRPAEPLPIEADPTRLAQIVGNLLGNASRYTPLGGHISLLARREGTEAVIVVSDDGIGIAPEALREIFEPFRQGRRPPAYAHGGLGLGLALVRRLVELHGGTVEAYSEGADKGSVFTVRLPALPDAAPAREERVLPPSAVTVTGCRVLVVDDDPDVAQSFAVLLSLMGYEVQATHTAVAALTAAQSLDPHVVFVDIDLPDMDGCLLAEALRRASTRADLHFVALTGHGQEEIRRRVANARFDAHLLKPVTAETVEKLLLSFRPE